MSVYVLYAIVEFKVIGNMTEIDGVWRNFFAFLLFSFSLK